ncbi:hypothetical protein FQR65_LT12604 [Abscondita terminalis]|nr:hypothetical protein FQR65_LT12604 [Abscondita terminalis]
MNKPIFKLESLKDVDKLAVENLCKYVQIPTAHPNPNYEPCVQLLKKIAEEIGLLFNVYRQFPTKPVVIISWIGKEPDKASILLNSHMDVVPAAAEKWTYNPFSAHINDDGNIHGRGCQDTKVHGIEYLEAIRKLKSQGVMLKRTVHVSFVPDEEIGGKQGMESFVQSQDFKNLNVKFALDEGYPGKGDTHLAAYGERFTWNLNIHIPGTTGHGSLLLDNTPGEKLSKLLTKIYEFRNQEKAKVTDVLSLGAVTTMNVTVMKGGVQNNVIPSELVISMDIRIPPFVGIDACEKQLLQWCKEAGDGIWIENNFKDERIRITSIGDDNPYWVAFKSAIEEMNCKVEPFILFGAVDGRFLRNVGVDVIDYSANMDTPPLHHCDNEFINVNVFLKAIEIYSKIIPAIANV